MDNQLLRSSQLKQALAEIYALEGRFAATRCADLYKAVDKASNSGVSLWILRHSLVLHSPAVEGFVSRMQLVQKATASSAIQVLDFGVDKAGTAFAAIPELDGQPLQAAGCEAAEIERRFMSAVRYVAELHARGVHCGDLCQASFWLDRSGEVWLIGVIGAFDADAASTAVMPPLETVAYMAPEQRTGAPGGQASDVFALGVLGYYLYTGRLPYGADSAALAGMPELEQVVPVSQYLPQVPAWVDNVLRTCLEPAAEKRFLSAKALFEAVMQSRARALEEQDLPVRSGHRPGGQTMKTSLEAKSAVFRPLGAAQQPTQEKPAEAEAPPASRMVLGVRLAITFTAVFAFSLLIAWQFMSRQKPPPVGLAGDLSLHRKAVAGNEQLKAAIDAIAQAQFNLTDVAAKLEELVRSDDPLAHDVLVKSALEAQTPELRAISEKAIIERTRRLGMLRSAEQVRQWLRTVPSGPLPPSYGALLKALNGSLPSEARDGSLREAYASNPKVALRFAAALALDSGQIADFKLIISQMVGDSLSMEDARGYAALSLILAHPDLALMFGDDVVQRRDEIPDGDIVWLLKLLADRNDLNVRAFANLAVQRGVLTPLRQSFLALIRDREDLPGDVLNSLVKAAAGSLAAGDIAAFGRWFDTDSERILLAICADAANQEVAAEAFDIMAGKSLTIQPSAALVEWVRKNYWPRRADFAKSIGTLANLDLVPEEAVAQAMVVFDRYVKDSRLIGILLDANNPIVTKVVLEKYSDLLSLGALLSLLNNPDKGVRILAVRALKPYNDIGALKIIIDHYEKEKDEEVKDVYRETFWMIERRG